jgi:hypothetical protein
VSQEIDLSAKFGIDDLLKHGPKTAGELPGAMNSDEPSLSRASRAGVVSACPPANLVERLPDRVNSVVLDPEPT